MHRLAFVLVAGIGALVGCSGSSGHDVTDDASKGGGGLLGGGKSASSSSSGGLLGGSSGGSSSGSTSSASTGSSGSSGSSSQTGKECISTGNATCDACLNQSCCSAIAACSSNAECSQLYSCLSQCQSGDDACSSDCIGAHDAGKPALQQVLACVDQSCAGKCG
jgi:hypothetical protein